MGESRFSRLFAVIRREEEVHDKGSKDSTKEAQETMLEFNKYKNKDGMFKKDTTCRAGGSLSRLNTTIYVSSYFYMCPHTTIYVSSYYYRAERGTVTKQCVLGSGGE